MCGSCTSFGLNPMYYGVFLSVLSFAANHPKREALQDAKAKAKADHVGSSERILRRRLGTW